MTMMKKLVVMMLTLSLVLSMGAVAFAVSPEDPNPTEDTEFVGNGCSLVPPSLDEDSSSGIVPFDRNPPRSFYDISANGVYRGSFTGLQSTMYTLKYFDTRNNRYSVRVRSTNATEPCIKFKIKNYCVDCNRFIGESSEYETPRANPDLTYPMSSWKTVTFAIPNGHPGHRFAPAVQNLGSMNHTGAFDGQIQVNYTNTWPAW